MTLSILIPHFNRSEAVKKCISSFRNLNLNISHEFIITDDGSEKQHLEILKLIPNVELVLSERNRGLGHNNNKGMQRCKGEYILYCQDDFLVKLELASILDEIIEQLQSEKLDMIRLTANYRFPKLYPITENIQRIPKLSFQNFLYSGYQYSDHPFIVKNDFYDKNGFYLEDVKGSYCETEYAIRMMKSKVKIGILKDYLIYHDSTTQSVLNYRPDKKPRREKQFKKLMRYLRAIRFHVEYLFYSFSKRELLTYKKKPHHLLKKTA